MSFWIGCVARSPPKSCRHNDMLLLTKCKSVHEAFFTCKRLYKRLESGCLRKILSYADFIRYPVKNHINSRHHHQRQEHGTCQPADNHPCHTVFHFRAVARCKGDGQHAENHGEGGRQDRAKAFLADFNQSVTGIHTLFANMIGKVH